VQEKTWIIWLALLAATLALEALSLQLFSVWFALGAAAALVSCAFGAPVWLQAALFAAVTAIALAATRPLVKRLEDRARPPEDAPEQAREGSP
jgi:membrane protein implicated in regulation of membrane protease activity